LSWLKEKEKRKPSSEDDGVDAREEEEDVGV
jgi:hypothetical protein